MNAWQHPQANGVFAPNSTQAHLDPASLNALYNPHGYDANHFPNNVYQQRLANRNGNSPAPTGFPNQPYQLNSVVPSKRPRPDDGMSASPRPPSGNINPRAPTPSQQAYGGFPNQQGAGQPFAPPTPYGHLQQSGSNNATPSPTMASQQFGRQPSNPQQRMNTASPMSQQGFGNQMSSATNQNSNQPTSIPPQASMSGYNQGFTMASGMSPTGMPSAMPVQPGMNMNAQQSVNLQRAYQLRLQAHQQQLRANGLQGPSAVGGMPIPMAQNQVAQNPHINGQMSMTAPGNTAEMQKQKQEQFTKALAGYAMQAGKQFNPSPSINGRWVSLYNLWSVCMQLGGSQSVDKKGEWQVVANRMNFDHGHFPQAPQELRRLHSEYIAQYERAWLNMRMQQKRQTAQQYAHQMAGLGPPQTSPTRSMQPPSQSNQVSNPYAQFQQPQPPQASQPMNPQATSVQANGQLPPDGMSTPQSMMGGGMANNVQHRRNSSLRKTEATTPQAGVPQPSPALSNKAVPTPPRKVSSVKQESKAAPMLSEDGQNDNYMPNVRDVELDGGYDVVSIFDIGSAIEARIPTIPRFDEMGLIDIRAITLSLASGIHAEVRYALDTLAQISHDQRIAFELERCEDLVDAIVDCAEDQVDALSEDAAEVSDALALPSYEDVLRGGRVESETLQDLPSFGSPAYDLDRAADRVVAITTILRNFSFYEQNHRLLTSAPLIKWLSNTVRLLGTRNMLLRSFANTMDFYKDVITYLSNITQSLELPSKDDALHVLHFLLAFAPQPAPKFTEDSPLRFTPFNPTVHRYLPPAIDCLAKLLARQDPNRMLYRAIFTSSSHPASVEAPLDLLTRAFALAIAVLPDRSRGSLGTATELRIVDARKPYLTQGMLAADILASLAPSADADLARAWIESEDGWALGLLKLAGLLSTVDRSPAAAGPPNDRALALDSEAFKLITHRALGMLWRIADKAGRAERASKGALADLAKWDSVPSSDSILGALLGLSVEAGALRLFCALHAMVTQP